MFRFPIILVLIFFAASMIQSAQRPLDLPSGGRGSEEDEEDAPETISFYGGEYEGDGFFWCLDKSGSMAWNGAINTLKEEMVSAISQMSSESEFGIVAYSSSYIAFSSAPVEANAFQKASAIQWVMALSPFGPTHLAAGGVAAISISNQCDKEYKRIIVVGDGEPNYPGPAETLQVLTSANYQRTPIDTIYIQSGSGGQSFMQSLAAMNGGVYSEAN